MSTCQNTNTNRVKRLNNAHVKNGNLVGTWLSPMPRTVEVGHIETSPGTARFDGTHHIKHMGISQNWEFSKVIEIQLFRNVFEHPRFRQNNTYQKPLVKLAYLSNI